MKTLRRALLAALALAPFAFVSPAAAQMTEEGTKISNVATVDYEDENGLEYPTVADTVEVTVGFLPVVDVTGPGTLTPASPSTGQYASFTLANNGNGKDTLQVTSATGASGLSITGYRYNATAYASLAALNTALAGVEVPIGGTLSVTVVYSVDDDQGGATLGITLVAHSKRVPAENDSDDATIQPPTSNSVSVTPDNEAITRFPGTHTETFVVENTGNNSDTFTLGTTPGSGITIVGVTGTGVSGGEVSLDPGETVTVSVEYTIDFTLDPGASTSLLLTATSGDDTDVDDTGDYDITITRPSVGMTKGVYKDAAGVPGAAFTSADEVLPGEVMWYKLEVTNSGDQEANGVLVTDVLPAQVEYVSTTMDAAGWTLSYNAATATVTGTLSGSLNASASRFFWIKVTVK